MEGEGRVNGFGLKPGRRASDWGRITLLDKTKEFFRTCDVEGKGFITRTDMRRLHRELPLSAEELEDVFDSLDTDHTGYLTLEAFSSGFSQFLHGRRISVTDDQNQAPSPVFRAKEALYQSQWEAKLSGVEDEEEGHFCMLLESLGASNVFEDPGEVRSLWAQLRRDEPHLLSNFEEFLARVTQQIKEAHQEKKEMESALQRKAATHDSEIRHLYEEMEAQIKNEKDRLLLKDSGRLQMRSQDLEHQLFSKEKELEHLFQKQKRLELQCSELSSEKQESHVENVKLKMTNDELSRALESTSQELALAQEQLAMLQEQAARLHQEKEMEMYRVTEGLQREKQSLMKQLDLLREMNKHLKDERDICCGVPRTSLRKKQKQRAGLANIFDDTSQPAKRAPLLVDGSYQSLEALPIEHLQIVFVASSSCSEDDTTTTPSSTTTVSAPACQQRPTAKKNSGLANGYANPAPPKVHDVKAKTKKSPGKMATAKRVTGKDRERAKKVEIEKKRGVEEEVLDAPLDGWPLRRVISIEEDHLPHLLQGGPQPLLHQLSEEEDEEEDEVDDEEEEEAQSDIETSVVADLSAAPPSSHPVVPLSAEAPPARKSRFTRTKKTPVSPRGQPVGKETQQKAKEGALLAPDRLFKVVLVGNSSVGKTSLLRSFCEGRFHPSTTATVGIDYSVKTLTLDNMQVAMQLWDTAGQERYRSITKQFFRKADGVVVMYDVTVEESFKAVQPWLTNVQDAAGEGIPVLLLGNKMDMDGDREVSFKEAEQLAYENKVMFFEVSAYTAKNVTESLTHLARVLMEQEDRVRDTTVILNAQPIKKKACCK
ncbi:EF-hand calcium-binding domain-containing protein 4B isoform X1 [Siniperca chuatsi]|uniref:EF-hand calcium-binding domain-containing protein 4B isoform X1 n=1 Tax=Siniperca chuatsi TaxID=119488 RepID=UPI001CE1F18C|nr:EF-hand calcium-binding domain-containing protein 4B isoform X1 [Siniperca chuatsi]XP_044041488.1 EF-hand calcium-binding domain-containing protein 4B isoform X1 [Siniperca chuatsi]